MPIYTYKCPMCGKQADILHKYGEQPDVQCAECRSEMEQIVSFSGCHILKGSGWYKTDFKDK